MGTPTVDEIIEGPELTAAVRFWALNLSHGDSTPFTPATEEERGRFSDGLKEELRRRIDPTAWAETATLPARHVIQVQYSPPPILADPARLAGIAKPVWPWKLFMEIEPGLVTIFDGGRTDILYSTPK